MRCRIRAEHCIPYKAYRWGHMYSTHTQASSILATFWPYLSETLTDTICFHTLDSCIWAAYGEYSVRILLFYLIRYLLLLTLQEPIQNPQNGVIHSIQDFPSCISIFWTSVLFGCIRPQIFNSRLLADLYSGNNLFIKSHPELVNRSAGVCKIILSNACATLYLSFTNTCSTQAFSQLLLHVLKKSTLQCVMIPVKYISKL